MRSANNELTTARNTPSPIVAAGKDDAPVSGTSPIAPTSNQGLAISLCRDSHHAMMAPIGTRTTNIAVLTASFLSGSRDRGLVLRHEILRGAGHAVIVGPAIDHRQLLAPVAVPRRGFRRLPLQRGGSPGIAAGLLTLEQAPDQVEQEHHLGEADS